MKDDSGQDEGQPMPPVSARKGASREEMMRRWEAQAAFEGICEMVCDYGKLVLAPRILVDRRRRAGDAAARVSDYDCRCKARLTDALPMCQEERAKCRFAHLKIPEIETWRFGNLKHDIGQAEARRILKELAEKPDAAVIAELERISRLLLAAQRRIALATWAAPGGTGGPEGSLARPRTPAIPRGHA